MRSSAKLLLGALSILGGIAAVVYLLPEADAFPYGCVFTSTGSNGCPPPTILPGDTITFSSADPQVWAPGTPFCRDPLVLAGLNPCIQRFDVTLQRGVTTVTLVQHCVTSNVAWTAGSTEEIFFPIAGGAVYEPYEVFGDPADTLAFVNGDVIAWRISQPQPHLLPAPGSSFCGSAQEDFTPKVVGFTVVSTAGGLAPIGPIPIQIPNCMEDTVQRCGVVCGTLIDNVGPFERCDEPTDCPPDPGPFNPCTWPVGPIPNHPDCELGAAVEAVTGITHYGCLEIDCDFSGSGRCRVEFCFGYIDWNPDHTGGSFEETCIGTEFPVNEDGIDGGVCGWVNDGSGTFGQGTITGTTNPRQLPLTATPLDICVPNDLT